MKIESNELQEYVRGTISAVTAGVQDTNLEIVEPIEFNLAVTNTAEGGGGMKIFIARAEGKLKSEEISHIKFEVEPERETVHVYRPPTPRRNPA